MKFGVPKNGVWFFRLKAMLAYAPGGAFIVGWDPPKGSKCYGYYESPKQFFKQLWKYHLKCGYEVFVCGDNHLEYPTRSASLVNCDVEWVGDKATGHLRIRAILVRIFEICVTKLGHHPEVYVLCGTRETEKGTKNSFHFIFANIYTEKCEEIKQLFRPRTLNTGFDDTVVPCDLAVYASTQLYRMIGCAKRGDDVTFHRINADPHDPTSARDDGCLHNIMRTFDYPAEDVVFKALETIAYLASHSCENRVLLRSHKEVITPPPRAVQPTACLV